MKIKSKINKKLLKIIHKFKKKKKIYDREYAKASAASFGSNEKIKAYYSKKRFKIIINNTKISAI
jgi:hypothetical protein